MTESEKTIREAEDHVNYLLHDLERIREEAGLEQHVLDKQCPCVMCRAQHWLMDRTPEPE